MSQTSFDWNHLRVFYIVAEAGSFTEAGKKLHLSQSAVSRQIAALEQDLGIPLFHRHARGLVMTEAGNTLFEVAADLRSKLDAVSMNIGGGKDKPKGSLTVSAPFGFGVDWLSPRISKFNYLYPDVNLTILIRDLPPDLTRGEADVAIIMKAPHQPGLIQKKLIEIHNGLYASEKYLNEYGMPKSEKDLDQHKILIYGPTNPGVFADINWAISVGREDSSSRNFYAQVDNSIALMNLVIGGSGIASLPIYRAREHKTLVRVLPDVTSPCLNCYLIFSESVRNSARIRAFSEFLVAEIKKTSFD